MSDSYIFHNGMLERSDRLFWADDETDFKQPRARHGFYPHVSFQVGDEDDLISADVYERVCGGKGPMYLADLRVSDSSFTVWVDDVPDLLGFLEKYTLLIERLTRDEERREAREKERTRERRAYALNRSKVAQVGQRG